MAQSVHYGTLAFRKDIWNPDTGIVYTDASLLDEVDFYNKVKDMPSMRVIELPNNGMHVYVRHPQNINRPGTDLAKDRRFVPTGQPHTLPDDHVMKLEAIIARMHRVKTRNLQEPLPTCGPCVEVDASCVTTDKCHDVYGGRSWSMCIDPPLVSSCTSCERSSDEICEERCVDSDGCQTLLDCHDMYADGSAPEVDCDRFPSCECTDSVATAAAPPGSTSPTGGSDKEAVNATGTPPGGLTQEPTASPTKNYCPSKLKFLLHFYLKTLQKESALQHGEAFSKLQYW